MVRVQEAAEVAIGRCDVERCFSVGNQLTDVYIHCVGDEGGVVVVSIGSDYHRRVEIKCTTLESFEHVYWTFYRAMNRQRNSKSLVDSLAGLSLSM